MRTTASLDLDGYFARIGYDGAREPTVESLHAITAAHSQSIPFENLDVLPRIVRSDSRKAR